MKIGNNDFMQSVAKEIKKRFTLYLANQSCKSKTHENLKKHLLLAGLMVAFTASPSHKTH